MVDDPKTIMEALSKVVGILKINVRQYVLIVQIVGVDFGWGSGFSMLYLIQELPVPSTKIW